MPQINRIRVNNVKYNFATQVYDDFVMRFNCKNTIYDLANGGGKSLLMLLLLQNMIPNCTLDEKQPIEKLFRQGGGNTCIHSLVEWKLDKCYVKDGFTYMTTGFCARKGKQGDDNQDDSLAQSSSSASIEYFNYCIFYREFGDNDIKNLPLSSNGEKITYNGLKNYLRELNKTDFKYEVYIFDKKGEYQSFITKYGIYESAWEIVRGINKTEGHVRTYFETNYKTSRKVIEDLLIEEIIQKSFNNRLSVDNDEEKMAETLLDIKDKLVELSKKHARLSAYDSQVAAIDEFREYLETYKDFYDRKNKTSKDLYNLGLCSIYEHGNKQLEVEQKGHALDRIKESLDYENKNIAIAEVMSEKRSLDALEKLVKESKDIVSNEQEKIDDLEKKLNLYEALQDYKDYLEDNDNLLSVKTSLDGRLRDDDDILKELKELAGAYYKIYNRKLDDLLSKKKLSDNDEKNVNAKYEAAKKDLREADKELAGLQSLIEHNKDGIACANKRLKSMMDEVGLLVPENAEEILKNDTKNISDYKARLITVSDSYKKDLQELNKLTEQINTNKALIDVLKVQLTNSVADKEKDASSNEKLENIISIYGKELNAGLCDQILDTYRSVYRDYEDAIREEKALVKFIDNVNKRTYTCDNKERERLKNYLVSQYGDDVVEGHEWFDALPVGQRRDVLKRTPFVEYGFIIKNDFERIKNDQTLTNFGRGAVIFPVISEQILIDTKLEVNKELVVFALKDMNFLRDQADIDRELKLANDELSEIRYKEKTLEDRKDLIWNDYTFVFSYQVLKNKNNQGQSINEIEEKVSHYEEEIMSYEEKRHQIDERVRESEKDKETLETEVEKIGQRVQKLKTIISFNAQISDVYNEVASLEEKIAAAKVKVTDYENNLSKLSEQLNSQREINYSYDKKIVNLKANWEEEYKQYYDPSIECTEIYAIYENDESGLESRFSGLRTALNSKSADVKDKENLIQHLNSSIAKCVNQIEYRGFKLEEMQNLYSKEKQFNLATNKLMDYKKELETLKKNHKKNMAELDSKEALYNRLDGSICYGINQIEEKYGEYKAFDCNDPEAFIKQHKELIEKLKKDVKNQEKAIKDSESKVKEIAVIERDLRRIVADAGMELPETVDSNLGSNLSINLDDYEDVIKEYQAIGKLEYKKKEEFVKNKQNLIDLLNGFDARELSEEIKISINIPDSFEKAETMIAALSETNQLIELEKDRIRKGIEDMERIKDNFENRCIQTCANIKTELDRLPKLSNINLDGEQISIISLAIPYVKEELYKDRMSNYIDETVVMAESFKDLSERLKYIRNRLSWKRLFSVIVTDMNAVRVNLYKRERIKDQSRYLKYEEAVGSTGQSQGIYIQFLIAIINYISNMNEYSSDGVTGKTIFIDNPFGAAKDIYIWEPIFKLLATNHVQLIVPARGATPAIIGRFDVNYILGQKLVDNKQQTVVVDYYSNTKESELEYTRMEYEQASFDFLT